MPRVKKAEREAVAAALMAAQDDLDTAAEEAIQALDLVRSEYLSKAANRPYVVLMHQEGYPMVYTYGPYATHAQAVRAREQLACPGPVPCTGWVQRLVEVPE